MITYVKSVFLRWRNLPDCRRSDRTEPTFRLYNPCQTEFGGLGNYLWTILANERNYLVALGWQSEGVGWYAL